MKLKPGRDFFMYIPSELKKMDNPHLDAARQVFVRDDFPDSNIRRRNVFICFTNRCGSNFLASALASGHFLNTAGEYFNGTTISDVSRDHAIKSLADYLRFLHRQESRNGILVSKIAATQLLLLHEYGLRYILDQSHFLFVKRDDLLAQAISTQIAFQTQQWTSLQSGHVTDDLLTYSAASIQMTIDDIAFQNSLWERFFSHNAVAATHVTYEQLVREPNDVLNAIFRDLELPPTYSLDRVPLRRQTRDINRLWRQAYLQTMKEWTEQEKAVEF